MHEDSHTGLWISILLLWAIPVVTAVLVARRDRRAPADDIGVMWLIVLALYCALPPLVWLLQGAKYGPNSGDRLYLLQPSAAEVQQLLYIGLAYSCSFAGVYLLLRKMAPRPPATGPQEHAQINSSQMMAALAIVVIFKVTILVIGIAGFVRTPESYMDSYKVINQLPTAARQLLKVGGGIAAVAQMVLLVAIVQRWPKQRLLFGLYVLMVLLTFDPEGSRTTTLIGLVAIAIAWHVLVRPIRARWWLIAGVVWLVAFIALGYRRNLGSWEEVNRFASDGVGVGEFDALWANALELMRFKEQGRLVVPDVARYGELWSFVPNQLLWFEKAQLSGWYVTTFYPQFAAHGGGWAFGALAQAAIGEGIYEAAFRGLVLGAAAAWIMKWYRTTSSTWWRLPLFMYLLITVFQSVRDTTFRQLNEVIQLAIPGLVVVALLGRLLARSTRAP